MIKNTVVLAYCLDNSMVADELESQLAGSSITFNHISGNHNLESPTLSEKLSDIESPILLIISDNFLKSAQCMGRGIDLLQSKTKQILPIVVDGVERNENTNQIQYNTTNFDRVSDIIKYINYWQDQYLELRRKKRQIEGLDETTFNARLKKLRDISSEVGEFLRLLRSMNHLSMQQLQDNDYEYLFRFLGNMEGWDAFKNSRTQALPLDPVIEEIPEVTSSEPVIPPTEFTDSTDTPAAGITNDNIEEEVIPEPESTEQNAEETTLEQLFEPNSDLGEGNSDSPEIVENTGEAEIVENPLDAAEDLIVEGQTIEPTVEVGSENVEEVAIATTETVETIAQPNPQTEESDQTLVLVKEALNHFDHDRIDEALVIMAQAVESNPQDPELRYHYALMLAKDNRDLDAAKKELKAVVELAENAEAYSLLGKIAEQEESYAEAKHYYEKVVSINPDYQGIYYKLGIVVLNHFEDQKELAATYFMEAIKHNPKNVFATHKYASLLNETFNNKEKALEYYKKVVDLDPKHETAYYEMAMIYQALGDQTLASRYYQIAIHNNDALATEENNLRFAALPVAEADGDEEKVISEELTLEALRNNINLLEELLRAKKIKEVEAQPQVKSTTVLITGATAGIGKATATLFAKNNYRIIINGRRADRLEELKMELEAHFTTEVYVLPFDIRDQQAMQLAFDNLPDNWSHIDILVNNAGKAKGLDPIHEGSLSHWEEMIDTNIKGLLYITRMVAPRMVARRNGHIINISSTAGKEVYPKGNVYCATKHAVEALTKAMRIDLHQHNVKVSQVSPGMVEETEFAAVRFDGDQERAKIYEDFNPLTSTDVAESIYFIATRPAHVNVQDVLMMGTQQANSIFVDRSGRIHDTE